MTVFTTKFQMKEEVKTQQGQTKILFKSGNNDPHQLALKRWLAIEIHAGRMTVDRALEQFDFEHRYPRTAINDWLKEYKPDITLSLPVMTEKERQKLEELNKQVRKLEKQLEEAQMSNIALNLLIDIAEKNLNIPIRKKSGTKQ